LLQSRLYTPKVQTSARRNNVIFAFLIRLLAATVVLVPPVFAQAFDPEVAQTRLDALETLLRDDSVSVEKTQNAQRRASRIRTDAIRCVSDSESLIDQLKTDLELLGVGTDQDPAEIIEQRTTFEVEIRVVEARVGSCRLIILHTQQILDEASALQAKLNTQRLTEQGLNGPSAIAQALRNPAGTMTALERAVVADPRLREISKGRWLLLIVGSVLAAATGWLIRNSTLTWCDQQRGRAGRPTVQVTFLRRLSEYAPLIMGGAAASFALGLYASAPRNEMLVFRIAVAVLIYGVGRAIINWVSGPFSPGAEVLAKESHGQIARTRLHALLVGILLGWVALGSGWLIGVPTESGFALRALLTIYLVAALWWVLRLGRPVPTLRGRLGFLRLVLAAAAVTAIGAELAGYRNLANHLLSGTLATIATGFVLWTVVWSMRQSLDGIVSGTSTVSYRIRSWMGMRQDERSAELGWLYMVISITLWIGFGWFLIWLWDPTDNAIPWLRELTLQGIDIGGKKLVPRNVFIGVTVFGVIIAITAWLKARLHRRWLRDMGMDRHAREALVTVSGYAGFAVALIVGLTLAGVSFAGMALVFGALSVGIGFGLQNIVNNFVSGLILLFERPIKPGDYVTIGEIEGIVKEVRTRATEVETLDRKNVLVPNSELVSNQVTNWVLRDPHGRLVLHVSVAYGTDTAKVGELLVEIANAHPEVVTSGRTPAPRALFASFGESALEFELRVWVRHIEKRFGVISDLNLAIDAAFRENGIVVPFPQRDLHVHTDGPPAISSGGSDGES